MMNGATDGLLLGKNVNWNCGKSQRINALKYPPSARTHKAGLKMNNLTAILRLAIGCRGQWIISDVCLTHCCAVPQNPLFTIWPIELDVIRLIYLSE